MSKFVGKEITISKIMPILLDLIKDEDCEVRLNVTKGLIKLSEIIGHDLLSDSILTSLSQLTKDTQWRVRQAVFILAADLGIKFGKDIFRDELSQLLFAFLVDTAAEVRSSIISKIKDLAEAFGGEWAVQTVIPKLNDVFDQDKQGYLYRMSVIKASVALIPSLSKSQITTHIIPILQKAAKDDIPNVKIALT